MSTGEKSVIEIEETLREYIQRELNGIYTMSMVVVQKVNPASYTATVTFKYAEKRVLENVAIASPYVGDKVGQVVPVSEGDEGFVLHNRQPLAEGFARRGVIEQSSDRKFNAEDAVFFPAVWNGDLTVPNHDKGDYLIAHDSGTVFRMKKDGRCVIEHTGGNVIKMGPNGGVVLGNEGNAKPVLNKDAVIEYEDTGDTGDGSASPTTKTATIKDAGTSNVDGA